eukprot:1161407-Pelagomonas_calceolata.AAC.3
MATRGSSRNRPFSLQRVCVQKPGHSCRALHNFGARSHTIALAPSAARESLITFPQSLLTLLAATIACRSQLPFDANQVALNCCMPAGPNINVTKENGAAGLCINVTKENAAAGLCINVTNENAAAGLSASMRQTINCPAHAPAACLQGPPSHTHTHTHKHTHSPAARLHGSASVLGWAGLPARWRCRSSGGSRPWSGQRTACVRICSIDRTKDLPLHPMRSKPPLQPPLFA